MRITQQLRIRPEWANLSSQQRGYLLNIALGMSPGEAMRAAYKPQNDAVAASRRHKLANNSTIQALCKWITDEIAATEKAEKALRDEAERRAIPPEPPILDYSSVEREELAVSMRLAGMSHGKPLPSQFTVPGGVSHGQVAEHHFEWYPEPDAGDSSVGAAMVRELNGRMKRLLDGDPNCDSQGRKLGLGFEIL